MIKQENWDRPQLAIAIAAGVNRSDVCNYEAGRLEYVSKAKQIAIEQAKTGLSKAQLVLRHLQSGRTITPLESLKLYGLHSLSQTVTRLRKQGHDIRNIGPGGPHDYGVYALFVNGVRV
jgi:hypothetical protein